MSEPVVLTTGERQDLAWTRRGAAVCFNGLLAGVYGLGELERGATIVVDRDEASTLQKRSQSWVRCRTG